MGIRLLFFFRDLFGFAICVGFGDLFFPRFVWDLGICFFSRDLLRDLGIRDFSFAICSGIWGFASFFRDLFGDLGISFFRRFVWRFGDLDFFLAICLGIRGFVSRFVWGFGDLFFCDLFWDLGIFVFFRDLFGDLGIFRTFRLGILFFCDLFGEFGISFATFCGFDSSGDLGLCFFAIRLGIRGF